MAYLIAQILFWLLLAFLLGLLVGWLLWSRREADPECEKNLVAARRRIGELERELTEARAAKIAHAPVPGTAPVETEGAAASEVVGAPTAIEAEPEPDPEPEPERDDLKRISGIGPVIERQLGGIGITTYRQIARFTDEDIERVGTHIDFFPDRIRREGWVEQAADFHREKYDSEP